jgi:2-oxoglutarate ferredoxin oxidoreductase subunit alpha
VAEKCRIRVSEHALEIVGDAGEGAQKAAICFAQICARSGNGLWTVEIIPSEIQPPPHTIGSASGNRIRFAQRSSVTNAGDRAQVVVAFNEMALLSRIEADTVNSDALILIDNIWASHDNVRTRDSYRRVLDEVRQGGGNIVEVPMETETLRITDDPRRGKNMFAVGLLCSLYAKDPDLLKAIVTRTFRKKPAAVLETAVRLAEAGYRYGEDHLELQFLIEAMPADIPRVAMNGNTALALGAVAAGFEICSMYPITPATSASHELAAMFEEFGGIVHQAEDEIAAIGVAVGASYAGKTGLTITSGPGMALKTEFQGMTVMTETPLVLVDVQRGGPSTGLPTKIEQGDLLHALFGAPGDAPKVVIAPGTIEECFYVLQTARRIAEEFRMLVIVLSDANLATGQQLFERPDLRRLVFPEPLDLSPVPQDSLPFDWDPHTGLSRRLIPGQAGGMCVTTSLNHDRNGRACYDYRRNQLAHTMRSRKLAALQATLRPPALCGDSTGELLVVGWGSTRGAIEEAVGRLREDGHAVSSIHIGFLNPLPPGLKEIFSGFRKVMTVELNYSDQLGDPLITAENRRYAQLAWLLRAHTLVDIDCFSRVPGRPFMPMEIVEAVRAELDAKKPCPVAAVGEGCCS